MAPIIVPDGPDPVEAMHIHLAVCRARRRALVCSLCDTLVRRVQAGA